MRVLDWGRHQHFGFVAGKAEHQTLVASPLFFLGGAVHALGDLGRLLADQRHHRAGVAVEAGVGMGVADVVHHAADEVIEVDPGIGRDLTANDDAAGLDHGFAGHAGIRGVIAFLAQDLVQHGVRNLVAHLVGMAFGDRLRSEEIGFAHGCVTVLCKTKHRGVLPPRRR